MSFIGVGTFINQKIWYKCWATSYDRALHYAS